MVDDSDPQTFRAGRFLFDGISVEKLVDRTGWSKEQIEGIKKWAESYVSDRFEEEGVQFDPSDADHISKAAVWMLSETERVESERLLRDAEVRKKTHVALESSSDQNTASD
ncbi:MAG: hypothetical protein GKR90_25730 [Pseudomonadales bacterium]|nr:hypothetical protein [Pseudomonadales bacterium]